jgi:H+/Cl- antiporter ClcA
MSVRKSKASNTKLVYIVAAIVVVIAFLLLGGSDWLRGLNSHRSFSSSSFCWGQIILSLAVGAILGWLVCKRRR